MSCAQLLGNSGADLFKPNIEEQLKERVKLDQETERWIVGIVTNHAEKAAARKA